MRRISKYGNGGSAKAVGTTGLAIVCTVWTSVVDMSGLQGEVMHFSLLTKSPLVIYLVLGVVRKQQVDQAIAHCGHHNCEDHINAKNAITAFRNLPSIVASVRFCLVLNVEEIDYKKPYSFDEVANKHDRNQTIKKISREITFCRMLCYPHIYRVHSYAFVRTHSSVEMDAPEILGVCCTVHQYGGNRTGYCPACKLAQHPHDLASLVHHKLPVYTGL